MLQMLHLVDSLGEADDSHSLGKFCAARVLLPSLGCCNTCNICHIIIHTCHIIIDALRASFSPASAAAASATRNYFSLMQLFFYARVLLCQSTYMHTYISVCQSSQHRATYPGVSGFRFRVSGFGFRVSGFGFRVSGVACLHQDQTSRAVPGTAHKRPPSPRTHYTPPHTGGCEQRRRR